MDRLEGTIQPYAWGDTTFLARLQGRPATGRPEAELWLGAHPVAPAVLASSGRTLLAEVTADPDRWLGPTVRATHDGFPFLLKILAAAEPLSIQAHPSRAQAEAGFAREEAAGLVWSDPRRMYRDRNHKPELLVALTRFEAKCGFRPLAATRELMARLVAAGADQGGAELARRLDPTAGRDDTAVLAGALAWLLGLGPAAPALVAELVAAAEKLVAAEPGAGADDRFEAELGWTSRLDRYHPGDVGVAVALLLNHVVLEPGQGVFLTAGNLHAYLEGAGVEIMANGDNVIRGGLTTKHVDGAELVAVVDTTPAPAPIQTAPVPTAGTGGCHRFACPVPEFSLTRLSGPLGLPVEPRGPEIVLVTAGRAELVAGSGGPALVLEPGRAATVAATDGPYRIEAGPGALVWRAAVGDEPRH